METWTRERDNRYRTLKTKKERHLVEGAAALLPEEEDELKILDRDNTQFIEAGLQFQRGEGIETQETIIVLLGYAIGLGNVWRFPYLVGKFGGLSFIIAYLVCLVFVAHPVYLLELAFGHTMRKSTVFAFAQIHPRWAGVGVACMLALCIVNSYYTVLLSYCAYYAVHSFTSPLPWSRDAVYALPLLNETIHGNTSVYSSAADYYFHAEVLGQSAMDPNSVGEVQGHLVLGLFVSYLVIYFAVFKGISFGAKLTYVTVLVPALFVCVISIRALALEGSGKGVAYYLGRFDIVRFFDPVMWSEACAQTLFTIVFLPGTTVTLASYMKQKEDIYRINVIVLVLNTVFSLVAGLGVFAILGHISEISCEPNNAMRCRDVEEFAQRGGPGLAFVALADGISTFGAGKNFFAFSFFAMLFLLGLDTMFASVETLVTYLEDIIAHYKIKPISREVVSAACCIFLFIAGLIFCVGSGLATLDITDHYVATYMMLIVSGLEAWMMVFDVTWDVLATQVQLATTGLDHINNGRGRELPKFLRITCKYVVPLACLVFTLTLFISDCVSAYGAAGQSAYSAGYQATGWLLIVFHIVVMIGGGYYYTSKHSRDRGDIELQVMAGHGQGDTPLIFDKHAERSAKGATVDSYSPPSVEMDDPASAPVQEAPRVTGKKKGNKEKKRAQEQQDEVPLGMEAPRPRKESDVSVEGTGKSKQLRKELEQLGQEELEATEMLTEGSFSE
eukprot:TRINITY_DN1722_c0_g1_i1.p1 TRINITY_DN1722_c0_g1~~TRINITY_DN1722_c0_g1_i1.p1  ORF type:complete len:739 (+),score=214.62 TRINITY_DN1722_c0_g1_i1:28-2217(+)